MYNVQKYCTPPHVLWPENGSPKIGDKFRSCMTPSYFHLNHWTAATITELLYELICKNAGQSLVQGNLTRQDTGFCWPAKKHWTNMRMYLSEVRYQNVTDQSYGMVNTTILGTKAANTHNSDCHFSFLRSNSVTSCIIHKFNCLGQSLTILSATTVKKETQN